MPTSEKPKCSSGATRGGAHIRNGSAKRRPTAVTSGAGSPSCAALLPGFVAIDSWDAVQANTYVVLGHGLYQRRVLTRGMVSVTMVLFHYLAYRLIGRQVDDWCMAPDNLKFLSAAAWKNLSVPIEADGSYSRCTMYNPPVPEEDNRTAVPCHEWSYDIANKADSIVSRFDLVCDRDYLYDLSSVVPIMASALVAPLLGLVSDRAGRKPVMIACAFAQLIATIGCSFSQTYSFFVSTRAVLFVATDALPFLGGVMLAAWCCLQEESPAWFIATRHIARAEKAVLLAAKVNGVDVAKARTTFTVIKEQLYKLDDDSPNAAPMERVLEAVKTRRRAISALLARFALDATFIGVTISDVTTGIFWEVAHVIAFAVYVASICVCIRRCGVRETLSSLLAILNAFCALKTLTIIAGQLRLKVAVSGATVVTYCYTAETFPTAVRNVGISLAHLAGGVGNVVAIAIIILTEPHANYVFYALSAFMVLLVSRRYNGFPKSTLKGRHGLHHLAR
ncbi:hypothetical protein HPB52_013564 [Rhipicephalus sanguineus]|uniref:Uncharacterized protein n=1 Tax=Rhipicephalus sanguineus TaxID=34632 RepID=A0A9D4PXE5_RHISA|nr:hypothetical protein HPB52_013564 [Rhipicephalus sanguineus]